MIGTTAALVLGGLAVGGQVAGTAIANRSANRAAQIQTQAENAAADRSQRAADQALAFNRQAYDDMRASYAPYAAVSQNALASLAGRMGVGLPAAPMGGQAPQRPVQWQAPGDLAYRTHSGAVPGNNNALMAGSGQTPAAARRRPTGPLVQMRAPNGQVRGVPEAQAAHFERLGAVRV